MGLKIENFTDDGRQDQLPLASVCWPLDAIDGKMAATRSSLS